MCGPKRKRADVPAAAEDALPAEVRASIRTGQTPAVPPRNRAADGQTAKNISKLLR